MNMKPILFNTDMVRAILESRKTVTRRVVKPQHLRVLDSPYHQEHPETPDEVLLEKLCQQPYQPGTLLYVRETWLQYDRDHIINGKKYAYKADITPESDRVRKEYGYKWKPSIHMPKEAARIFLRVTGIRVERLQDITDDDIVAEGLEIGCYFDELWDKTIKPAARATYGWMANPWVWVIEFERCEKSEVYL